MEIKIYKEYESFINVFGKWIIQIVHVVYMHLLCLFTHTIALSNLIINSSLFSLGSFQGKISQQLPKKFKWETQVILCLFFISSEKKLYISFVWKYLIVLYEFLKAKLFYYLLCMMILITGSNLLIVTRNSVRPLKTCWFFTLWQKYFVWYV